MREKSKRARGAIDPGDIIIVEGQEYGRPYNGKKWLPNFWTIRRALRVDDITNNGTIHAHDKQRQRYLLNAIDEPPARYIVRIIRRRPA